MESQGNVSAFQKGEGSSVEDRAVSTASAQIEQKPSDEEEDEETTHFDNLWNAIRDSGSTPPERDSRPGRAERQPPERDSVVERRKPTTRSRVESGNEQQSVEWDGDDKLTLHIHNADIREILELLSEQGNINILASRNVEGSVTASLVGVDLDSALEAIVRSAGLALRRDGDFVFIGLVSDLAQMDQANDEIQVRVYRPSYVPAADLMNVIQPILTANLGKATVSKNAESGLPQDLVKTGGNQFAGDEVLVVRDYGIVLDQVDEIVNEIDSRPRQVSLEATILSVKLDHEHRMGVHFEALRNRANVSIVSGSPPTNTNGLSMSAEGATFGFLDGSLANLIDVLEDMGDVSVVASPRVLCLNKLRAEVQIGEQLGFVNTTVTETSSTQSVSFLDVGTLLRIRPFITPDGMVRLELHPELSNGSVSVTQGLTLPRKEVTQVTTNIMCPSGRTVIIGGLIREDLETDTKQLPILGNLPYVGALFRRKGEISTRRETLVLVTPTIVNETNMAREGASLGDEYMRRHDMVYDNMSILNRRRLSLRYLRMARSAFAVGDNDSAMRQVNLAIHFDPTNRECVELREAIAKCAPFDKEGVDEYLRQGMRPWEGKGSDHSEEAPWKRPTGFNDPDLTGAADPVPEVSTRTRAIPPRRRSLAPQNRFIRLPAPSTE